MHPIALICAVRLESAPVLARLAGREPLEVSRLRGWSGRLGERRVVLFESGITKANAAHTATVVLEHIPADFVLNFGVAGAYPESGLQIRDTAIAESETYGDEGVEAPGGWLSCEGMGFPLLDRPARYYETFPVDPGLRESALAALAAAAHPCSAGPFVTVSTCSGTSRRGLELGRRHSALCETMEGAAVAHVCAAYQTPFLEVRAISNRVEDRDLSGWDLAGAAERAAAAVTIVVSAL